MMQTRLKLDEKETRSSGGPVANNIYTSGVIRKEQVLAVQHLPR